MARKKEERSAKVVQKKEKKQPTSAEADEGYVSFRSQLAKLGLQLREITGDGNCLFRALGDQYDGTGDKHEQHRQAVADYMMQHREDFEPFVEDDVPFDKHIANLRTLSTYAGNDAIVAFARLHGVNVIIHQVNSPCWQIHGCDEPDARQLHISYHNGDHYSSIRRVGDYTTKPANIHLKNLGDISDLSSTNSRESGYSTEGPLPADSWDSTYPDENPNDDLTGVFGGSDDLVRCVMAQSECQDRELVESILAVSDNDSQEAILKIRQVLANAANDVPEVDVSQPLDHGVSCANNLWSSEGTGTRIFGNCHADGRPTNGARPKQTLPTQLRKRQAKAEKKKRAEERHRQAVSGSNAVNRKISDSSTDEDSDIMTVLTGVNVLRI